MEERNCCGQNSLSRWAERKEEGFRADFRGGEVFWLARGRTMAFCIFSPVGVQDTDAWTPRRRGGEKWIKRGGKRGGGEPSSRFIITPFCGGFFSRGVFLIRFERSWIDVARSKRELFGISRFVKSGFQSKFNEGERTRRIFFFHDRKRILIKISIDFEAW